MNDDSLLPKPSLITSAGRLWQQSPLWKAALLGAVIFSGLILLDPPWEWGAATPHPVQHAAGIQQQPVLQQSENTTMATQPSHVAQASPEQPLLRTNSQPIPEGFSSQIAEADQNCGSGGPMHIRLTPPPAIEGEIEGFLSDAEAMSLIPKSEQVANGQID